MLLPQEDRLPRPAVHQMLQIELHLPRHWPMHRPRRLGLAPGQLLAVWLQVVRCRWDGRGGGGRLKARLRGGPQKRRGPRQEAAKEEWCHIFGSHVGIPCRADKRAFASFRDAINDLFFDDEEESGSLKEDGEGDDEGDDEVGKLKSEVPNLESRLRAKCDKIEFYARPRKKGRSE